MRLPPIFTGRSRVAIVAGVAVLSMAALAPIAGYAIADSANDTVDAVMRANAQGDALADLENRSPGGRLGGIATKAKRTIARLLPGRPDEAEEAPEQRALGKVFDPPAADDFAFAPLVDPETPVMAFAAPAEPLPGGFVPIDGNPGVTPGGPGGSIVPPGGGGGGGNPPVPGVPEPETWALMILGFGFIGAAMRRQSRKVRLSVRA